MLKAFGSKIFIEVDFDEKSRIKLGGKDFYIDTTRDNTRRLKVLSGKVYAVTKEFSQEYSVVKGDIVYCHHFLLEASNRTHIDGKELCLINTDQVYFKLSEEGDITPFGQIIIVKPVIEHESNYISPSGLMLKATPDEIKLVGDVIAVSNKVTTVSVGDRIRFSENSDYDIYLPDGSKIYKMRASNFDVDYIFNNKEDVYDIRYK